MEKTAKIVESAIDVLEQIARSNEDVGVTELSRALNLPKSTMHRILLALTKKGLVSKNERNHRYVLGLEFLKIAGLAVTKMNITTIVHPYLEKLRDKFMETAVVAIRSRWTYTYIAEAPSLQEHAVIPLLGSQSPLHTSAFGKSILAFLADTEIEEFLNSGLLVRLTDQTVIDPGILRQEVEKIRKQYYSLTYGQRLAGSIGIASPIVDRSGSAVASIGIVGPYFRMNSLDIEDVIKQLVNASKEISSMVQLSREYGVIQISDNAQRRLGD